MEGKATTNHRRTKHKSTAAKAEEAPAHRRPTDRPTSTRPTSTQPAKPAQKHEAQTGTAHGNKDDLRFAPAVQTILSHTQFRKTAKDVANLGIPHLSNAERILTYCSKRPNREKTRVQTRNRSLDQLQPLWTQRSTRCPSISKEPCSCNKGNHKETSISPGHPKQKSGAEVERLLFYRLTNGTQQPGILLGSIGISSRVPDQRFRVRSNGFGFALVAGVFQATKGDQTGDTTPQFHKRSPLGEKTPYKHIPPAVARVAACSWTYYI